MNAAKGRAVRYTERTIEELDKYPEAVYAVLVACSDYYNNRSSTVVKSNDVFEKVLAPLKDVTYITCVNVGHKSKP